jgi:hypothetical protein
VHRRLPVNDTNSSLRHTTTSSESTSTAPRRPLRRREAQYSHFLAEKWRLADRFKLTYGDPFIYDISQQDSLLVWRTTQLQFKFENLLPLLHFLANSQVCFRGRASELTLKLTSEYLPQYHYQAEEDIRKRLWAMHIISEMDLFASQLHAVYHAIRRCGLGSNLISAPTCTRLVISDYEVLGSYLNLRNKNGITLEDTVATMANRFASCYYINVAHAEQRVRRWSEFEDTMRLDPGFSQESWDRRLRLRMETVSIYEEAGPRLHAIMQDLWGAPR